MKREAARNRLIAEDAAHFGRPLTDKELAAIDADLNRACGGKWVDWCMYKITRFIDGYTFNSRAEAAEFFAKQRQENYGRSREIENRDRLMDRAWDQARSA